MESAKELISKKLTSLRPELTTSDFKEATNTLKLSRPTLDKYLVGEGTNADQGLRIYEFFHGRIKERIQRLKAIA